MKLYLIGHDYRYAAEQMMLTLFPAERPEYPSSLPGENEACARLKLSRGKTWATAAAEVRYGGRLSCARCRVKVAVPGGKTALERELQHAVKLSFYRAATALLGGEPAWGALTGVRPVKLPVRALREGATPAQAEHILKVRYRVSPLRRRLAMDCARASLALEETLRPEEISLYVGIPFCPSRCAYCSFISAAAPRALKLVEPYLEALHREIEAAGEIAAKAGLHVRSVYVGGGTPTTLSALQLLALLKKLRESFDLSHCTEFTVEAGRPDTITREKLEAIAAGGAGRVSVNPQSMSDRVLRAMGRAHTAAETLAAYELVRAVSGLQVNMDLIAGLPADTLEGFRSSLDTVLALAPENITVHTLALKKGSRLMEEGGALPGGDAVAAMLDYAHAALREGGYIPYYLYRQKFMSGSLENVGWCLPGCESVYNICMMEELHTVLALGAGGVTKLVDGFKGSIERISNPKYPQEYLRDIDKILDAKGRILTF